MLSAAAVEGSTSRSSTSFSFPSIGSAFGSNAVYFQHGWRCALPFDLVDLDEILAFSLLRYPFVRMYESRGAAPLSSYTTTRSAGGSEHPGFFSYPDAMRLFAEGYSIELGAVHQWHPAVARMATMLASVYHVDVDAQIFITPAGAQGLTVHRDLADGFALHLAGSKRWRVYRRAEGAWSRGATDDPGEIEIDVVLHPGDLLYFPAGAAHEVVSVTDGVSAHITFGMQQPGAADMASLLLAEAPTGPVPGTPVDDAALLAWLEARIAQLHAATRSAVSGEIASRVGEAVVRRNALPLLHLSSSDSPLSGRNE
jgi:hypothetical protein